MKRKRYRVFSAGRWYPRLKDVLIPDSSPGTDYGFPYTFPIQFGSTKQTSFPYMIPITFKEI